VKLVRHQSSRRQAHLHFTLARDTDRLCSAGLPYIRLIPKVTAVAGETLHLKCPVAGYPIEEIRWERSKVVFQE
jgi:hypothetical protein